VVRHVALRRRQGRRALGSRDEAIAPGTRAMASSEFTGQGSGSEFWLSNENPNAEL
jgi:hypothetical protein